MVVPDHFGNLFFDKYHTLFYCNVMFYGNITQTNNLKLAVARTFTFRGFLYCIRHFEVFNPCPTSSCSLLRFFTTRHKLYCASRKLLRFLADSLQTSL